MSQFPEAVTVVVVAFFALLSVSLIAIGLGREARASGRRERWVEALTADLAAAIAAAGRAAWTPDAPDRETAVALGAAAARIRLRLDPEQGRDRFLVEMVDRIEGLAARDSAFDRAELENLRARLTAEGRARLAAERARLSRGGAGARIALYAIGGAVSLLLFLGLLALLWGVVH